MRVDVRPELLRWARERAGKDLRTLARRIPQLAAWEDGTRRPTLKQLEQSDFRTLGEAHPPRPSADLLDTIYVCQQRQESYRDFARVEGEDPLPFVASAGLDSDVWRAARGIGCEMLRIERARFVLGPAENQP